MRVRVRLKAEVDRGVKEERVTWVRRREHVREGEWSEWDVRDMQAATSHVQSGEEAAKAEEKAIEEVLDVGDEESQWVVMEKSGE